MKKNWRRGIRQKEGDAKWSGESVSNADNGIKAMNPAHNAAATFDPKAAAIEAAEKCLHEIWPEDSCDTVGPHAMREILIRYFQGTIEQAYERGYCDCGQAERLHYMSEPRPVQEKSPIEDCHERLSARVAEVQQLRRLAYQ